MLRIIDSNRHFASRPPGGGDSRGADTSELRQLVNGKGEQSPIEGGPGNWLALFTWRGVWRAAFDRAFLSVRDQRRRIMRPLSHSLTPCVRHLTDPELKAVRG